jgi:hypothetical protein
MENWMYQVDNPGDQFLAQAIFWFLARNLSGVKCHDITSGYSRCRGPRHAVTHTTQHDITTGPPGIYPQLLLALQHH